MALQMTWNPTLSLQLRKPSLLPLGLKNLGNSCYLNSVLQCLTYTPPLAYFCLTNQHSSNCHSNRHNCPFCLLERRIVRSLTLDAPLDAPSKIHSCLTIFSDHFRHGTQEDAHEFLRYVIDACHNTSLRLNNHSNSNKNPNFNHNNTNGTVVKEIFGGALRSQVKCFNCGSESNKTDEIMDISLDLFQSASLKDAMQRFFQPEVLDGSNKYRCERCKKLVAARKQMSILQAPNVLVIQLKRFEGIHGSKIDRMISFEEVLVLSSYMCKESQDPRPEYSLFGTIVHSGYSPESGHYYAYIKDAMGRWYCCNDSHVSLSNLQEVLSEKVYILFFSRTNQRPRTTKTASSSDGAKLPCNDGKSLSSMDNTPQLKGVAIKPHEAHYLGENKPTIPKNGKITSSPRIKFGNFKALDSKRLNVNGHGNSLRNGHVEGHVDFKEPSTEKTKEEIQLVINNDVGNENKSSNIVVQDCKQKSLLQHANGKIQSNGVRSLKKEVCDGNGVGHMVTTGRYPDSAHVQKDECKDYPPVSGSKRKSVDKVSENLLTQDGYQEELEKFKKMLAKDASSSLRSCGWHDQVYSFMRTTKKLCFQAAGNSNDNLELKKRLIAEARPTFISRIPESLKQQLIERLRSFSQGKQILDA